MNKLPAKQIYLLTIIIIGIIALSVYSTYALFTFESSTSDIVSIHTPKSLQISENIYEYQQLTLDPNSVTTTDIDIYNSFEYDVCYSIWYKIIGDSTDSNKVQIFQKSDNSLTSSGVLAGLANIRVTLALINDNDKEIKVNLGTIGEKIETESCSLNLTSDKKIISSTYNNIENLNTKLLKEVDKVKNETENYLTYKDENTIITYKDTDKIYISEKFKYNNELFTLENSEYITIKELVEKEYFKNKDIYFCKESDKCIILYKIKELEKQESTEDTIEQSDDMYYNITKYDKLVGYSESSNGLRKINNQDYIFYGDNPNNFIYYNCKNNDDIETCELWRIIGLFYNKETNEYNTKIIRNDSIGKYQFDYNLVNNKNESTNNWDDSNLSKYLNEEYEFSNNYDLYIEEVNQEIEQITSLDINIKNMKLTNQTINSKINLINLSDYIYTSSCEKTKINEYTDECITNNWLNNPEIQNEWTLTSKEIIETNNENNNSEINEEIEPEQTIENNIINYVYSTGANISEFDVNDFLDVRPVIFLKSRMLLLEGNGTFESPYIIK